MHNELQKIDDIFSRSLENIDIDIVRALLAVFNFNIPEEQLPYIQITGLEKWRITFTNNFTNETVSSYYTNQCPAFDNNFQYSGESEKFLAQKIQSSSVTRINWFVVQGERLVYNEWKWDPIYIPPYKRNKLAIVEQAIFSAKTADGSFVLIIQKDYPNSDKRKNLNISIYKGTLEDVYSKSYGDVMEPDSRRQIVMLKYALNKDYNYFQTGSTVNKGKLNEARYTYGRNMFALTDGISSQDDRLVYGVEHKEVGNIDYSGVVSEAGYNSFERLQPFGMLHLPQPFEAFEKARKELISKMYFQGYEKGSGNKTLGIVKAINGIKIVRDEVKYDDSGDFRKRLGYERVEEIDIPSVTDDTITIDEIENVIGVLRQNNPDDKFVNAICSELEMFIEQKTLREKSKRLDFQISDINNPNSLIHFDTEFIIDMITSQGIGSSISSILRDYSSMFRNSKEAVINCNRDIEEKQL